MSTRSGRTRSSVIEPSPPRTRNRISPPRSPARTRKVSPPAQSPSRKSPARKSPSRKSASKYPARKSPSRTTNEITKNTVPKISPSKRQTLKQVEGNIQGVSTKVEVSRSTRTRRSEYSIKDLSLSLSRNSEFSLGDKVNGVDSLFSSTEIYGPRNRKSVEEVPPRRSIRLREYDNETPNRSSSKSLSKSTKSMSKSVDTFSDQEQETPKEKSKSITRKLATPLREISVTSLTQINNKWEFGGRFGTILLLFLLPLTVFGILISCVKDCTVHALYNGTAYKTLAMWFNIQSVIIISSQLLIQTVFVLLPIPGKKDEKYYFNAFFSSMFTAILVSILDIFKIWNADTILNDYLKLSVVSYIFGVLLSFILFIKSRKVDKTELNPCGSTGYALYDFWIGREIHPQLKRLNVKIWISRISNINCLILLMLIFKNGIHFQSKDGKLTLNNNVTNILSLEMYKDISSKVQLQTTIMVYSMMQMCYILYFIMQEHKITSTFFWHSEGVGYLQIVASALYPFYFTTISKYVADTGLTLSSNILITTLVMYVVGLFIMLLSNNIKYEFRKNPLHPSFANMDSMPTFHGNKLLISGVWGLVRHPNYAGDILIHFALAIPGIVSRQYVASAPALLTIIVLLHRSWRDHSRCRRRYGAAWQRYCKKVPSVLIPKVF